MDTAMTGQMLLTMAGGLALALALVLVVAWLARAFGFASAAGSVRIGAGRERRLALSETIALDTRRRLHLVRCDGRDILVLTGGGQDVMLPLDAQPEAASK
jgi:flagellar protein FliO/FliZ